LGVNELDEEIDEPRIDEGKVDCLAFLIPFGALGCRGIYYAFLEEI
jgi:hypothetical protein